METLRCFAVLLAFQFVGECLSTIARLPIPGPVIGMVLLALFYIVRKQEPGQPMQRTADTLLGWLGLLFVPAGVGVVANMALLRAAWFPVTVSLVVSTFLTLLVTAWVMHHHAGRQA